MHLFVRKRPQNSKKNSSSNVFGSASSFIKKGTHNLTSVHILGPNLAQWDQWVEPGFCSGERRSGRLFPCPTHYCEVTVFSQNMSLLPSHSLQLSAIVETVGWRGSCTNVVSIWLLFSKCNVWFDVWKEPTAGCLPASICADKLCLVLPVPACVSVSVSLSEHTFAWHIQCRSAPCSYGFVSLYITFFLCFCFFPPSYLFCFFFFFFSCPLAVLLALVPLPPRHTSVTSRLALSNPISCWWRGWMRRWLLREWCRLSSHCPPTLKCKWNNNSSYEPRRVSPPLLCAAWELSH